jgi:lysozyme
MAKSRNRIIVTILTSLFLLAILSLSLILYLRYFDTNPGVFYKDFGIRIPGNYQIHGIDVSKYQKKISWEEVGNMQVNEVKLGFVFMKATQGTGTVDPRFERNWYHAGKVGLVRGAYHYFNVHESGRSQAHNFMQIVKLKAGDLPPVIDIEQIGGVPTSELRLNIKSWLKTIEHHYGVKPIIYTYSDFYEDYLLGYFDEYPLWVAHYHNGDKPRTSRNWHFWQHNEDGRVNGINAPVDFNVFNGDSANFRAMLIK